MSFDNTLVTKQELESILQEVVVLTETQYLRDWELIKRRIAGVGVAERSNTLPLPNPLLDKHA
jgi:hypothetical protein